jgi:L-fuconolactonase
VIDAHQHFWTLSRGDYGWITPEDVPALCRDFGPKDLCLLIQDAGISHTVLVQCAETLAETRFLLDIARETDFVAGVVGWVDFASPSAADDIADLAQDDNLVSMRPMLQDMDDKAWILRPELEPAFKALAAAHLAFDILIKPPHLPHMPAFLRKYPDLPMVIDHFAKPYIAAGEMEPWASQIRELARHPRLFCKLSGLATEAGDGWDAARLKPYVDVVLEAFGPSRLMWGSDWPVLTLAGSYPQWFAAAQALTSHLTAAERGEIFGGTAARFYGLQDA